MADQPKNGSSANKVLSQALAIATLMAAFTGLFIPIKHYADRQNELEKEMQTVRLELSRQVADLATRLTVLETRMEVLSK